MNRFGRDVCPNGHICKWADWWARPFVKGAERRNWGKRCRGVERMGETKRIMVDEVQIEWERVQLM